MAQLSARPAWTELPYGSSIPEPGTARNCKTGTWRSARPEWSHAECVRCGVCVLFCPEGCLALDLRGYPGADLDYCKGCGICVHECVTGCIRMVDEVE
ncbi:MAG TPA: 4Fe-4S binding protein [Polyangia bacterium]|jgi:pyruvate ferredoxin oxidoreductase delta subunit